MLDRFFKRFLFMPLEPRLHLSEQPSSVLDPTGRSTAEGRKQRIVLSFTLECTPRKHAEQRRKPHIGRRSFWVRQLKIEQTEFTSNQVHMEDQVVIIVVCTVGPVWSTMMRAHKGKNHSF